VNLATAAMFWIAGAWPVPVFLGLDVLGVFIAFQISYRGARIRERVMVSGEEVRVRYETPLPGGRWGAKQVWASPTPSPRWRWRTWARMARGCGWRCPGGG
jgi:uncharacterized membrane protein